MYQGNILEELLHTINQFNNQAKDMKMSSRQMWKQLPRIQGHGPSKVCSTLLDT